MNYEAERLAIESDATLTPGRKRLRLAAIARKERRETREVAEAFTSEEETPGGFSRLQWLMLALSAGLVGGGAISLLGEFLWR